MLAEDLTAGAVVKVPKGVDPARPSSTYLLHLRYARLLRSGAVEMRGEVRRLDGTPTTQRYAIRTLTVLPNRLEASAVRPSDLAPTQAGIGMVLREAGFRRAPGLPQRATGAGETDGFQITASRRGTDALAVRWSPAAGQADLPSQERQMLERYSAAIRAAGWHAEVAAHQITVTARNDPRGHSEGSAQPSASNAAI